MIDIVEKDRPEDRPEYIIGQLDRRNAELRAEIECLTPYVEAFRREEARADKYGGELDEKDAEIERLRACRTELDYVVEYHTHGLRPLDLRDWYSRACAALKDTKP